MKVRLSFYTLLYYRFKFLKLAAITSMPKALTPKWLSRDNFRKLSYRKIVFSCLFLVFPLFFLFLHFEHEPWNLNPGT